VKKVSNRLLITSLYSAFAMLVNSKSKSTWNLEHIVISRGIEATMVGFHNPWQCQKSP
jgi:hypothetical protein